MKQIIRFLLFSVIFFSSIILSCSKEEDKKHPRNQVEEYYNIIGMELYQVNRYGNHYDTLPAIPEHAVQSSDYYFGSFFDHEFYFVSIPQQFYSSDGMLYALTPLPPGYKGSKIGVDTIFVISQFDYNSNHLANDTMNDILRMKFIWHVDEYDDESFAKFFEYNSDSIYPETDQWQWEYNFKTPPDAISSLQQFRLIIKFNDGRVLDDTTKRIYLKK